MKKQFACYDETCDKRVKLPPGAINRWITPLSIAVSFIGIMSAGYSAVVWLGNHTPGATLDPRVEVLETNQREFLKTQEFKEFTAEFWSIKRNDAVTEADLALTVREIQTSQKDLQHSVEQLHQDLMQLKNK